MHLIIICGPAASGKTRRLCEIEKNVSALGERVLWVCQDISQIALERVALEAAHLGYNALLLDDCNATRLQWLRDMALHHEHVGLVLYAVEAS